VSSTAPSNLHKVFWPQAGLTKGDLLDYLGVVAPVMVPALRNRPLTVKRYPDGIEGGSFFQKNTPAYAPPWVRTIRLRAESARRFVDYTVCNSRRTLLWLGNQATIEFHPWSGRVDRLDHPDQLIVDFDPPEGRFEAAVEAALAMRPILEDSGLQGAAKTSGAKGVHVYVPLRRRHSFHAVRAAADWLAERMVDRHPRLATVAFSKAERGGRVLVDVHRNAPSQHTVAPYSPRARPEATVSFPVSWEELDRVRPQDFTVRTVPELLRDGRDPWRDLLPAPQNIPRELVAD
jgi:bifunctional non-homologous end joining protein LigD